MRGYVQFNKYTHTHTHTHTPNGEDGTSMLGYADARRFGGRYAGRTESIPLR